MEIASSLTKSQLSDGQATTIYGARWGIELFFRTFKQTFGRRKLRSRSAENAPLELDWSMLGLWCVCLLGQRELAASGDEPGDLSAAATIRAFQQTLRDYRVRPEAGEASHNSLMMGSLYKTPAPKEDFRKKISERLNVLE